MNEEDREEINRIYKAALAKFWREKPERRTKIVKEVIEEAFIYGKTSVEDPEGRFFA